jgi:hypothetical protein
MDEFVSIARAVEPSGQAQRVRLSFEGRVPLPPVLPPSEPPFTEESLVLGQGQGSVSHMKERKKQVTVV